jgi:NADH-quinone oxidoreductase subunit L
MGGRNHLQKFLAPVLEGQAVAASTASPHETAGLSERTLTFAASGAAVAGFMLAWWLYYKRRGVTEQLKQRLHGIYVLLENKYYVDELYTAVVVRPLVEMSRVLLWRGVDAGTIDAAVNDSAKAARGLSSGLRRMQSGNVRSYAGWVVAGAAVVAVYMVWVGVR